MGGFPYYRIPALADLGGGRLLASYDGRPNGGDAPNPNSILQRASDDDGKTWGPQTVIEQGRTTAPTTSYSDSSYVVDSSAAAKASNNGKPIVFNFHVYGKDQGYAGSAYGSDDNDRNVLSLNVSTSYDEGVTWTSRHITSSVKQANWKGTFVTSGEGIQLKYGPHAGRLVVMAIAQIGDPNPVAQAVSVYSDDHGTTWHAGTPAGSGMDENKVVELSNGDLMMNSRASDGTKYRKTAISTDGGVTWGPVGVDTDLPDPNVNASISRLYPDAAEGSAQAKMLLFSNSDSQSSRSNGAVRLSCDDGKTWPGLRVFNGGAMAYSTLTALADGTVGLLYENGSKITFAKFDTAWLDAVCAPLAAASVSLANGATANVGVTVTNQQTTALSGATATVDTPVGWSAGTVTVPTIPAGGTATVSIPITAAPSATAGARSMDAVLIASDGRSRGSFTATVTGGATTSVYGVDVYGERTDGSRDLATDPYAVGEAVPYQFKVYNAGNRPEAVVPTKGDFDPFAATPVGQSAPAGNCRWGSPSSFQPGASYICSTPRHAVTADELADGYFVPQTTWTSGATAQAGDATLVTQSFTGAEVDLLVRKPAISVTGTRTVGAGSGTAAIGDALTTTFTVTNSGNVRITGLAAGQGTQRSAATAPTTAVTCGQTTLDAGAVTTCTSKRALSADDLRSGIPAATVSFTAQNGSMAVHASSSLNAIALNGSTALAPGSGSAPSSGSQLASTGLDLALPLSLAALALAIGIALTVVTRLRARVQR
ncbi:exo-alpha-sialidase [Humibacter antri]